jgi:hypothetical protein
MALLEVVVPHLLVLMVAVELVALGGLQQQALLPAQLLRLLAVVVVLGVQRVVQVVRAALVVVVALVMV